MDDLNGLRVFLQVAEARSFSGAGRRLGLTASAVSKSIARLEHEFGVRLLHRNTRHVGLTNEGLDFYERCRQVLADLQEAETLLTQSALVPRGRLRVHMPMGFGRRVVLPALARLIERSPHLLIDVELGERAADPTEEGLDAAIRFGELPNSCLIARRLCDVRFVVCAAPSYLDKHGAPQTPDDLDKHVCLGYETPWSGHYREWQFAHEGQRFTKPVSGNLNVNDAESLLDTAVAGAGIAMVGAFVAYDAVRAGKLQVLLKDYIAPGTPVSVLYNPGRQRSPRLRWFLDMLQDLIPSLPPWNDIIEV